MLAERMKSIDSSGIRKVFDLAAKLENPINLSIGQPDFDIPDEIKEVGINSIREGFNSYTVTQGIPELHAAIRDDYRSRFGVEFEDIFITSGVSGGLTLAFIALVEPGDEVLVLAPCWPLITGIVHCYRGVPVVVPFIGEVDSPESSVETVRRHRTPRTVALYINTPNNPTGKVIPRPWLGALVEWASAEDLWVISDEVYDKIRLRRADVVKAAEIEDTEDAP